MKLTKTMKRVLNSGGETTAIKTAEKLEALGLIKITFRYVERARLGVGSLSPSRGKMVIHFDVVEKKDDPTMDG